MTREEAEAIASVFETADGGCSYCIEELCREANELQLGWTFNADRTTVTVEKADV